MDEIRRKVLIVDDDRRILAQVAETLSAEGFDPVTAGNALEALYLLENAQGLALIVVDIRIPGRVDGILFSQLVAERGLPVIVISGKESPDDTEIPPGASFIGKPFRPADIAAEARRLAG